MRSVEYCEKKRLALGIHHLALFSGEYYAQPARYPAQDLECEEDQQITRAMQMVSAAKLQRAQDRLLTSRPYSNKLAEVVGDLALRADPQRHPLLQRREGQIRWSWW